MKLSQPTNLRVEDYPDQAKWIGRLFTALNPLFTQINQIFDGNIDYSTNIRSVTREYDTQSLTLPLVFEWGFSEAHPQDVEIVRAKANGAPVVLLPAWDYNASTKEITISEITQVSGGAVSGVRTGTRYKFAVRATV